MTIWMTCARRTAILAALGGASLVILAGADICATGVVTGGSVAAHYGAAALTFFGL